MSSDELFAVTVVVLVFVVFILLAVGKLNDVSRQYPDKDESDFTWCKVRHVIDGDTVIVSKSRTDFRIRLDSIDYPENGQHWGNMAKAGLIKLVGGRCVLIEQYGIDIHGRTLATIYVEHENGSDLINVNERTVMLGHAWVMRKFYGHLSKERQYKLNRLERWARWKRVGLWKTGSSVPPRKWRNQG